MREPKTDCYTNYNNPDFDSQSELTVPEPRGAPTPEPNNNPTRIEYDENGNVKHYYKNNILIAVHYPNGNFKVLYDDDGNLIAEYDENGNVIGSTPQQIDYSKFCLDEYHNFQEPTINTSASKT